MHRCWFARKRAASHNRPSISSACSIPVLLRHSALYRSIVPRLILQWIVLCVFDFKPPKRNYLYTLVCSYIIMLNLLWIYWQAWAATPSGHNVVRQSCTNYAWNNLEALGSEGVPSAPAVIRFDSRSAELHMMSAKSSYSTAGTNLETVTDKHQQLHSSPPSITLFDP